MALLAVLIVTPCLLVLAITARCAITLEPECWNKPWPGIFRDWLSEAVPVLVAIIVAGSRRDKP